jgi:hypothetical protein
MAACRQPNGTDVRLSWSRIRAYVAIPMLRHVQPAACLAACVLAVMGQLRILAAGVLWLSLGWGITMHEER